MERHLVSDDGPGPAAVRGRCETVVVVNNIAWGKEEGGCSSGVVVAFAPPPGLLLLSVFVSAIK